MSSTEVMNTVATGASRGAAWPVDQPLRSHRQHPRHSARPGRLLRTILVLGFIGILAMWWSVTPATFVSTPAALATAISELSGLLGGYLVCLQLVLVARIPWFEHAVGLDRLIGWHRVVGPSSLLLICCHVVLIVFGTALAAHATVWGGLVTTLQSYPDMLTALIGTIAFLAVGFSSVRWVRAMMPYELWYWLHLTTYVAVFLTFFHQLSAGPAFLGSPFYRFLWLALYLGTAAAVVAWRFVLSAWDAWRHRMRVAAVIEEGTGTVSIWLSGRRLADRDIRAGRFMIFRFMAWGHLLTAHPYSISRTPQDDHIRITVGGLGDHSRALRNISAGTLVFAEGPFGHFTAERSTRNSALLVAGGAGIGPICALAKDLAAAGRDVVVLYRARSADRLALASELSGTPRVRVIPLVGARERLGFDPLAPDAIAAAVPDARDREAFICGSPGMSDRARSSLRRLGVSARHIHSEELSMS
jgi:Predicted ferric reductase